MTYNQKRGRYLCHSQLEQCLRVEQWNHDLLALANTSLLETSFARQWRFGTHQNISSTQPRAWCVGQRLSKQHHKPIEKEEEYVCVYVCE
jgi:cbb3-type cytochrome oxidase cytochrome c subunit